MDSRRISLESEAETIRLGEDIALALKPGDCLALSGDLGAGKSTFARAVIRAVADDDGLEVPSPTFTLVQTYPLRLPIAHFDLYRIADPSEIDELGFDEALADGACLVEWPERAGDVLPDTAVTLCFQHEGEGRTVEISGGADLIERIGRTLSIRAFLSVAGYAKARRRHLTGDASVRAYERITAGQVRYILMDSPRHKPGPILRDGKYYQQIAHIAEDVTAFVAVGRHLKARGFAAPAIYREDLGQGILLIEDLGSGGVLDAAGMPVPERYLESAACLARLHGQPVHAELPVGNGETYRIPDFDRDAMQIEASLLIDWYLPWKRGSAASEEERDEYQAIWDALIGELRSAERNLLLRDFHSPNIIWRDDRSGTDRVGIIDFQDAMIGPTAYDLASLVQDARTDISEPLADRMMQHYLTLRAESGRFDRNAFLRDWHIMAAQRNCKLAGIWVRLMRRDGKPGYMKHMPRTFRNLQAALAHPALSDLREWCIGTEIL
ncbi:MAG: tRNA (adenosine(37)-N6)-threonylcarbamoyltransferase complex ATPase subunit type 1 TsaE [Shinella sp.]|nr:tRNA (adenosine(37)-N6)-threonylcarbamoyltransferase complex ATPase subunit type 1 TsaE [Shinella sp.]